MTNDKEFEYLAEHFAELVFKPKKQASLKELKARREAVQKNLEYARINDVNYHLESEKRLN